MKDRQFSLFCLAALALIIVLRTIELVNVVDNTSGFFVDGQERVGYILSAVTLIIICGVSLFSIAFKSETTDIPKPSLFLGCAELMLGAALICEPFFGAVLPSVLPQLLVVLRQFSIILTGLVFIYFGISMLLTKLPRYEFLLVAIASWLLRLLVTFMCYTSMADITSNNFEILMIITILLFLTYHIKSLLRIGGDKYKTISRVFSSAAFFMTGVCSLPPIIATVFFNYTRMQYSTDSVITNLFLMIYIFTYMTAEKFAKKQTVPKISEGDNKII